MNKRSFLKTSSILLTGAMASPYVGCNTVKNVGKKPGLTNWAGNLEYTAPNIHTAKTVEQVQELVRRSATIKALGSRHSFNRIADNREHLLSMIEMNKVVSLDKELNSVTVEAGMRYGELAPYLHKNGYSLPNLASLPHISIAGACSTATHGSGIKNGNLATSVSAIEFVSASGDLIKLSKNDLSFNGAVVSLGAIGVITRITLDLEPTFNMKQVVYRNLPMSELKNNFNALQEKGYSVSLFTDWKNKNINEVWIKSRAEEGDVSPADLDLFGAKAATENLHPVEDQSAESVTQQLGVPGSWYDRMPHFKLDFQPSTGKELQSEYFVPVEHAYEAMMAIEKLHEKISPHLFISEIRTIAEDNLWMSPFYKSTCVSFHTTWKQDTDIVSGLLPLMEQQLAPFNARPHWAKLFRISPQVLRSRYERLDDFKQLVSKYDPQGKFRNEFLQEKLYNS